MDDSKVAGLLEIEKRLLSSNSCRLCGRIGAPRRPKDAEEGDHWCGARIDGLDAHGFLKTEELNECGVFVCRSCCLRIVETFGFGYAPNVVVDWFRDYNTKYKEKHVLSLEKQIERAEVKLEQIRSAKRARDANRKEARRIYDQQEAERKRTQDPMIRRTLMSDEQRRMDQKVVKLLQKAQSTTDEEAQELRHKALYLVQKYDITIVKKEVLEWLHQPTTSAGTPSTQLASASLPSLVSSLGE